MQTERLGKYEIRGILGKGAMGTVYDGYDAIIDRRVAIKTMVKPDADDAEAAAELARFRREAQAAGRLAHPNIVGVYDYGEEGDTAYIVMEYAPGTELKKLLDKGERMVPAEAVRIMQGVLAGLQYSHERGVVHRDIKPGNIILSPDGTVKIADFGIARIESSSMTQAGTVLGTPAYMSPEQFMGQTVDARTDIYSAGVMFYQLLTGERPFDGSMSAIMHKALHTEAPRPSDLSVTAPAALDAVVARAMAKRPEGRFESAAGFAAAIRAALEAPPADDDATMIARPQPRPVPPPAAPAAAPDMAAPPGGQRRWAMIAGAGAVLLALAGAGGYYVVGGRPAPAPVPARPDTPPVPKPVAAPPPAVPVPGAAQIRDALAGALRNAGCSLTQSTASGGRVLVTGVVGSGEEAALRGIAEAARPAGAPADAVSLRLGRFDGETYCRTLDLLRGAAVQTLALGLPGGVDVLHEGDLLKPQITLPDFPAWLTVDYIQSDGSITHMYPSALARDTPRVEASLGAMVIGGGRKVAFRVGSPFGTDMIFAIASSVPLFTAARPDDDTSASYLAALDRALQDAGRHHATIAAAAMLVTTRPK